VALFCSVLTLWSAFAFAAHHHSNRAESAKCTLCVAAHSAAPKAVADVIEAVELQTAGADALRSSPAVPGFAHKPERLVRR